LNRPRLRRFKSRHEDNPTLFDQTTGEITERGVRTMATLDALTGVRYKRGRLGLWVGAEGQVYEEWANDVHVVNRFAIPPGWRRVRVIDFGFNNPFVCQWWAIDHDGRMYLYRELYMSGRTVKRHKVDICIWSQGERYEATLADHDAEDRATLAETTVIDDPALVERLKAVGYKADAGGKVTLPGIGTKAADKRVKVGIEKVQERLRVAGDGKPRIFLLVDSLIEEDVALKEAYKPYRTADEFPSYVWMQTDEGRAAKEEPVKLNDHGMDALRYMAMYLDGGPDTSNVTFGSITKSSMWGGG
jgi:phage terminase large subunit